MDGADPGAVDRARVLRFAEVGQPAAHALGELPAAFSVKVEGEDRADRDAVPRIAAAIRSTITAVLPDPALAASSEEPVRASIAARCSTVNLGAALISLGRSPGERSRPASRSGRARGDPAGAGVGGGARGDRARLLQAQLQRLVVADVAVDVAARDVVADHAARTLVGRAERLLQGADDLHAELLTHGQRVQGGLDLPSSAHFAPGWTVLPL